MSRSDLPLPPLPREIAAALPFQRRMMRVAGRGIHFIDHGQGRPVLMVHGNPTWSFLWRNVIAALPEDALRVIAPDLLGFGLSEKPTRMEAFSMEALIAPLVALVEALDLRELTIVAQDMGGPVATGVASRCPERVRAAVFLNTAFLAPKRPLKTTPFHRLSQIPLLSDLLFRLGGFPLPLMNLVQGDRKSIDALARRAYRFPFADWRHRLGPLAVARMVPDRESHPSNAVLARCDAWARRFTGPTRLVWGVGDPILGRAAYRICKAMPQATLQETDGGHFLQEEYPEAIAAAIRDVTLCE